MEGGKKKPERQRNNEKKHIFHTPVPECWESWVTAPNQLLASSSRCGEETLSPSLCTSSLGEFRVRGRVRLCPCCVFAIKWELASPGNR